MPSVLKGITCHLEACKKIGIVGRTGSGKSTLVSSLFRIIEPTKGTITIDGMDISTLGLATLRSKMCIIPQDPVLFSGTLRNTLDPFGEHTDFELYEALKLVRLHTKIDSLEGGLDAIVAEYGSNFSVGERQLVLLAQGLLKKTKILILDEATGSLDNYTDQIIQDTIQQCFPECTIITIAHRLNTIMNSHLIVVLNAGRVVEIGEPKALVMNPQSWFVELISLSGQVSFLRSMIDSANSSSSLNLLD